MALARPLSYEIEIEVRGNTVQTKKVDNKVRQKSQEEIRHTKARSRARSRVSPLLVVALGVVWVCAVGVALLLVQRWAAVSSAGFEITRIREELVRLETEQQALQAEASRLQSLASIEERALALGMQKPATAKHVVSDPSAVANRVTQPATASAAAPEPTSLWQSVRSAVGGLWQQGRQFTARLGLAYNKANASGN